MALTDYREWYRFRRGKRLSSSVSAEFDPMSIRLPAPTGHVSLYRALDFGDDLQTDEPLNNGWLIEFGFGLAGLWFTADFWVQYHIGGKVHESPQSEENSTDTAA